MRVKILQGRAGVDVSYDAGEEYEIPDGRAARWIASGFAEAVGPVVAATEPVVETAVVSAAEVPEAVPVVEVTVKSAAPERATKGRRK